MAVTFYLPTHVEQQLRLADPQLDESAREQFLIAQYVAGKVSTSDIAEVLGHETRFVTDQWLVARGVHINYSQKDLEADRNSLDRLLGQVKH